MGLAANTVENNTCRDRRCISLRVCCTCRQLAIASRNHSLSARYHRLGSLEIRLSDLQMDNIASGLFQFAGRGLHFHDMKGRYIGDPVGGAQEKIRLGSRVHTNGL